MSEDIDMDTFFFLIKKRPVLWDQTLPAFKDSEATELAWKDVCIGLKEDFEDLEDDEQLDFTQEVIKKWTGIRNAYANFCKKEMEVSQSGARTSKVKKFVYSRELNFLQKFYKPISAERYSEMEEDNEEQDQQYRSDGPSPSEAANGKGQEQIRKRRKKGDNKQSEKRKLKTEIPNRHLLFFQSVLPSLETMEEYEIVKFNLGVLQLINKLMDEKRTGMPSSYYPGGSVVQSTLSYQPFRGLHAGSHSAIPAIPTIPNIPAELIHNVPNV
ncbi:hypothetical protein AAG570_011928 [Ranatra chinensis]|uniref:MADF domain-containing protein n=1 Tax=Ranatra chinensis TaxID=642074 RepID=A0ABD0YVT0_9HEMI